MTIFNNAVGDLQHDFYCGSLEGQDQQDIKTPSEPCISNH